MTARIQAKYKLSTLKQFMASYFFIVLVKKYMTKVKIIKFLKGDTHMFAAGNLECLELKLLVKTC